MIMGPNFIEDNLILVLDPANPKCFAQGQTTATNLITGGLVTGANGTPNAGTHTPNPAAFPDYNPDHSGVFDFTGGGKGINCEENLGSHNELSLSMWLWKATGSVHYISDARNDGGKWFLSNYVYNNINYTNNLSYNFGGSYIQDNPLFTNRWIYITAVSSGSYSKLYINGEEVNIYQSNTAFNRTLGKNFRIGTRYTHSNSWKGYMGSIHIYNKELTPEEVLQNYTATKSRYNST